MSDNKDSTSDTFKYLEENIDNMSKEEKEALMALLTLNDFVELSKTHNTQTAAKWALCNHAIRSDLGFIINGGLYREISDET